jgi:hypothetical protein
LAGVVVFFCAVTGGGMGFFIGVDVTGFLGSVEVAGFLAVVEAMGAFRTGVGVDFLRALPGTAFLVPMGWATIFAVFDSLGLVGGFDGRSM